MKVLDPVSGWCEIRPYSMDIWRYLLAAFKCKFLLLSATMDEDSLNRVLGDESLPSFLQNANKIAAGTLEIEREDLAVLYKIPDRPNIFSQLRKVKEKIDIL